jgi:DNA invertase Pin-like site-specific DNA recombinase
LPCARSRTPAGDAPIATPHPAEAAKEPKARGRHRSLQAEAAILKATLYLLERQPLRKVTADAIARRAGVSKTTIYKWRNWTLPSN